MVYDLDMDAENFTRPIIEEYFGKLGTPQDIEMRKRIPCDGSPEDAMEVGLYGEAPFFLGECILHLESVGQVQAFLDKVPTLKRALGREAEDPVLFFAATARSGAIKGEAIGLLDSANCHRVISGDLRVGLWLCE